MTFSRFFFSSRRRHTISYGDWSSDVCSSDLIDVVAARVPLVQVDAAQVHDPEERGQVLDHRERSEERRVGKECRCRWATDYEKEKTTEEVGGREAMRRLRRSYRVVHACGDDE